MLNLNYLIEEILLILRKMELVVLGLFGFCFLCFCLVVVVGFFLCADFYGVRCGLVSWFGL